MSSTVVVIGANGQLGSDLVRESEALGFQVVPLTHQEIEVEHIDSVRNALLSSRPEIIMNTAAFHVVPRCEENPEKANAINAIGALNIARVANEIDAANVYFSTDYVFDGAKRSPYVESDAPNPLSVYGTTKLSGEYYTLSYSIRGYVLRVSGIYGRVPCRAKGGNFITTMIRVAHEKKEVQVVRDEILTPTATADIARATMEVVQSASPGLYHATNEGMCSWYEFAEVIFEELHLGSSLRPKIGGDSPGTVRRPSYSVLENAKMKAERVPSMPYWKDSLVSFLRSLYG